MGRSLCVVFTDLASAAAAPSSRRSRHRHISPMSCSSPYHHRPSRKRFDFPVAFCCRAATACCRHDPRVRHCPVCNLVRHCPVWNLVRHCPIWHRVVSCRWSPSARSSPAAARSCRSARTRAARSPSAKRSCSFSSPCLRRYARGPSGLHLPRPTALAGRGRPHVRLCVRIQHGTAHDGPSAEPTARDALWGERL